jgi:hypothetical protein
MSTWSTSAARRGAGADHDLQQLGGSTRFIGQDRAAHRERRQLGRLDHHRIAREQRRNRVAERQVERARSTG